jgi:fibronectin-binding autotransporter adhesin
VQTSGNDAAAIAAHSPDIVAPRKKAPQRPMLSSGGTSSISMHIRAARDTARLVMRIQGNTGDNMNRIYRLVWNQALRAPQVASELARDAGAGTSALAPAQRVVASLRPLALALSLALVSAPAWSACSAADIGACGSAGGAGIAQRTGSGGNGNGTGGGSSDFDSGTGNTVVVAGSPSSNGSGGNGAAGENAGGTGGSVGELGGSTSNDIFSGVLFAGDGGAGANGFNFASGGGGGGAGIWYTGTGLTVSAGASAAGGKGGAGGNGTSGSASNGGGGGGGGVGLVSTMDLTLLNLSGPVTGGAGGAGGNGGNNGGGGSGGDGVLTLGTQTTVTINSSVVGGDGGAAGIGTSDNSALGGSGGAGVHLFGSSNILDNYSQIRGGDGAMGGVGGTGVIAGSNATINNWGTISGGLNPDASQALALAFTGGFNSLNLQPLSAINGGISVAAGAELAVYGYATGTNLTSAITLGAGSELDGSNLVADGLQFSGDISGSGQFAALGGGTITLTGNNTYTGGTTIQSTNTLQIGNGGTSGSIVGDVNDSGVIAFNRSDAVTYNGVISGTGGLKQVGPGMLTLTNDNAYSGGTTIMPGTTLQIGNGGSSGSITGGVNDAGAIIFNRNDSLTYSDVISGSGSLTKTGPGTLFLANANTYDGGTTIVAGELMLDGAGSLSATGRLNLTNPGATFDISNAGNRTIGALTGTAGSSIMLGGNTLTFGDANNTTFSGEIEGRNGIVKQGSGTASFAGSNMFTGGVTVDAGAFALTGNGLIAPANTVTLQGSNASFDITGAIGGRAIASLAGVSGSTVFLGPNALTLVSAADTFGGALDGTGALAINNGREVLNGINSNYTGTAVVASGATLIVGDASHATATLGGGVNVAGTLGGTGTIAGNVTVNTGGALTPGDVGALGTLSVNGDLTINNGATMNFDFGAPAGNFTTPGASDHVVVGGNLAINQSVLGVHDLGSMGPGLYNLFSWGGSLTYIGGGFSPPPGMSLQTLTADKQINLIDTANLTLNAWDANGLASSNAMGGGSGTWSVTSNTWADTTGQFMGPMAPQPAFAIFGGASGTVTVDDSGGTVDVTGMQFFSDGYHLTGDTIVLAGGGPTVPPIIRVSAGATAVIDNLLVSIDGIEKTDAGTLVLTAQNPFTGNVVLAGGELSVSSDGNLGNAINPLDFEGGTLQITGNSFHSTGRTMTWGSAGGGFDIADATNTFTVAQNLTGSGGLYKTGAGTLVLSGSNTYGGGTLIGQGTLQGDTTSLHGDITNNATLTFAQNTDGNFAGAISGSGQLVKNGGGTVTLAGVNSYSGGTLVNAGTLQGDTSSLQGNITDNATVSFVQTGDGTFDGVITGSGALHKSGSGTLTLTHASTYGGGTFVDAGTLQGDTSVLQGNITNNATLVFAQNANGVFNGNIAGTGSVVKNGAGTLTFDDANAFSGTTEVTAGKLVVGDDTHASASLGGMVTVDSGATLGGIGQIGGMDLAGTLTPGNSIGTLHVSGNATFRPGSSYQVEVTPDGSADQLAVAGHVSILGGSAVSLASNGTWAPNTSFNIITAGGQVSGKFDQVSSNLAFLTPSLVYTSNAVSLLLTRNDIAFASVANTPNQRAVAAAVDAQGIGHPLFDAVSALTAAQARATFDGLSGEQYASTRTALFDDSRYVRDAIDRHLLGADDGATQATDARGTTVWTSAWGHWGDEDGNGNAARMQANGSGLLLGADLPASDAARVGAVIGHRQSSIRVDDRGSNAHTTSTDVGFYGDAAFGAFALRGGMAYAWQQIDSTRHAQVGLSSQSLGSRYDAGVAHGFVEGAWRFEFGKGQYLEPFLNVARVHLHTDGVDENGGAAALAVGSETTNTNTATLGVHGIWALDASGGLRAHATVGWQQAWGDLASSTSMRFVEGNNSFEVAGVPIAQHAAMVEGGVVFDVAKGVSVDASYTGRFADHATDQGARLSVAWRW